MKHNTIRKAAHPMTASAITYCLDRIGALGQWFREELRYEWPFVVGTGFAFWLISRLF